MIKRKSTFCPVLLLFYFCVKVPPYLALQTNNNNYINTELDDDDDEELSQYNGNNWVDERDEPIAIE